MLSSYQTTGLWIVFEFRVGTDFHFEIIKNFDSDALPVRSEL